MTTFSQLVDEMVLETRRPDLKSEIASYVNQTVREIHFSPDKGNAIRYAENLRELSLTADSDTGYSFTIPSPDVWQQMWTVRYDSVLDADNQPIYVNERSPGRALNQQKYFYYRAANYYTFAGYGGTTSIISIAYYEFPKRLKYYESAARPATWDEEDGWAYADGIDTDEEQIDAQYRVSNWILIRWSDVVREGVRAKVYKRVADTTRAQTSYSLYMQLRMGLWTAEKAPGESVY